MSEYITVREGGHGRYEEKKSVFLGEICHAETEDEAMAFVQQIRKKNYDARHNCFAWSLREGQSKIHASDDGEPSGTAGRPILDVLTGAGVTDAVLVVTRYFGGTLLGTGGLVRAYTAAARDCLAGSALVHKRLGEKLLLTADYTDIGRIQHMLGERQVTTLSSEYTDKVRFEVILPKEDAEGLTKDLTELTAGRILVEDGGPSWYEQPARP
ncbi:MAG: YigZ family protein [Eubacteriales bacterium]|jgi:uncharacterized YigZ family protein